MVRTVNRATANCVIRDKDGNTTTELKSFGVSPSMDFDKCLTKWANKNKVKAMRIEEVKTAVEVWEMDDETFFKYATLKPTEKAETEEAETAE